MFYIQNINNNLHRSALFIANKMFYIKHSFFYIKTTFLCKKHLITTFFNAESEYASLYLDKVVACIHTPRILSSRQYSILLKLLNHRSLNG